MSVIRELRMTTPAARTITWPLICRPSMTVFATVMVCDPMTAAGSQPERTPVLPG